MQVWLADDFLAPTDRYLFGEARGRRVLAVSIKTEVSRRQLSSPNKEDILSSYEPGKKKKKKKKKKLSIINWKPCGDENQTKIRLHGLLSQPVVAMNPGGSTATGAERGWTICGNSD